MRTFAIHIIISTILVITPNQLIKSSVSAIPSEQNAIQDSIPTGIPLPIKGKWIDPKTVAQVRTIPLLQAPEVVPAHPNIHPLAAPEVFQIPKNIPRVRLGEKDLPIPKATPIQGKTVLARHPVIVKAISSRFREGATTTVQFYDEDHGLRSAVISSLLTDRRGHLWIGTVTKGLTKFDGTYYYHYTTEQGLSGNNIRSLMEDQKGNIWISTIDGGVSCFDGHSFTQFTEEQGLNQNVVYSVMEDRLGDYWFAGGWELMKFSPTNDLTAGDLTVYMDEITIVDLVEDSQGNIWIAAFDEGLWYYDGTTFINYGKEEGFTDQNVRSLTEDKDGNIWIATTDGVFRYDGKTFSRFTTAQGLIDNNIAVIREDKEGQLWMGSLEGACRFDGKAFTYISQNEGLSHNLVSAVEFDENGGIWLGTYQGLNHISSKEITHISTKNGLFAPVVNDIMEDSQGRIWFCTYNSGISCYDGQSVTQFTKKQGLLSDITNAVVQDQRGNLWIGTSEGLSKFNGQTFTNYTKKEGLNGNLVSSLAIDQEGQLWIGSFDGGLCMFDGVAFTHFTSKEGLTDNYVRSILQTRDGGLWLCTRDGMSFLDKDRIARDWVITHYSEEQGIEVYANPLLEDKRGNVWISSESTLGNYLWQFDGINFQPISKENGLQATTVNSATEDSQGRIWLGTDLGVELLTPISEADSSIKKQSKVRFHSQLLSKRDGIIGEDFSDPSLIDQKNRLWLGRAIVTHGVNVIDLNKFRFSTDPPHVVVDNINVKQVSVDFRLLEDSLYRMALPFGKKLIHSFDSVVAFHNYPHNWTLPYQLNHLTFHFTATDWAAPHKIQYQYQLEGQDENWSVPSSEATADYRNLGWGHYTFKVRAIGEAQVWSEPFEYSFSIKPPWWHSWWAYLLYLISFCLLLWAIYRFLLRRQLAMAEAHRLRELDQVKSRLYTNITHEFRTPLTVISGMADQVLNNPKEWFREGMTMIKRNSQHLLQLVNQLLDLSKLESGSLEVQLIQDDIIAYFKYLTESFHSFAASKDIRLHLLPETESLQMDFDPKKIQTIVSNLISNAIKFTHEGGDVYIKIKPIETTEGSSSCEIKVVDTGVGISAEELPHIFDRFYQADDSPTRQAEGTGIGLALTKELVKLLQGTIEVHSQLGKGTTFEIVLPISRKAPVQKATSTPLPKSEGTNTSPIVHRNEASTEILEEDHPLALLIEDNEDVLRYLRACLQDRYRLETAINGSDGIEKAIALIPDIIISDVMMPIKDGFEVLQTLKKDERTSHIPMIMLTAKADIKSRLEGLEYGADAYLSKPFNQEELDIRLRKLIELRKQLQQYYLAFPKHKQVGKEPSPDELFLAKLHQVVIEHLEEVDFDVNQLCRLLAVSRTQLHRKLKALTGSSATQVLRSIRLQQAKQLLENTEMTVSEIGYAVGLSSRSYFTQIFKEEFGESPSFYRKT